MPEQKIDVKEKIEKLAKKGMNYRKSGFRAKTEK